MFMSTSGSVISAVLASIKTALIHAPHALKPCKVALCATTHPTAFPASKVTTWQLTEVAPPASVRCKHVQLANPVQSVLNATMVTTSTGHPALLAHLSTLDASPATLQLVCFAAMITILQQITVLCAQTP